MEFKLTASAARRHLTILKFLIIPVHLALLAGSLISRVNVQGIESNVLYTIQRTADDHANLYTDPQAIPYAVTQYNPLYYMAAASLVSVLPAAVTESYGALRFLFRLISAILLGVLVLYAGKIVSLFRAGPPDRDEWFVLYALLTSFTLPWFFIVRPDVFLMLFYVVGVYHMVKGLKTGSLTDMLWAGFFAALAFCSKQNGLFLSMAFGAFALFSTRFRLLAAYVAAFLSAIGLFVLVYIISGYPVTHLYDNLVTGISNGIHVKRWIDRALNPFLLLFGLPALVFIYFSIVRIRNIRKDAGLSFLVFFTLTGLAFALASSLKVGSSINYFNDTMLFVVITGFVAAGIVRKELLLLGLGYSLVVSTYQLLDKLPSSLYFTFSKKFGTELAQLDRIVEAETGNGYFYTNIRNLILSQHEKAIFPQYDVAWFSQRYDNPSKAYFKNILDHVDYRRLKLVVIDTSSYHLNLDLSGFELTDVIGKARVYRKRAAQHP